MEHETQMASPATVEYRVETRTITLTPSTPKIQDLEAKLAELELQLSMLREEQTTRAPRVISAIIAGVATLGFSAISALASMSGNDAVSISLLTPAFIGAVTAVTLVYLISRG